jgi:hypothetical protein
VTAETYEPPAYLIDYGSVMMKARRTARPRRSLLVAAFMLTALTGAFVTASHSVEQRPARLEKHTSGAFDQILRENALFFNLLVTFSFTLAVADPEWGVGVRNINVNLITRAVRDVRGHQLVRVRVAGVVRKNHNVELDVLNDGGALVGKAFFGYSSGQITFFDRANQAIINGFIDSRGGFLLYDLRLPQGKRSLSNGFVDPCFDCSYLSYGWWDALDFQIGAGRIYPSFLDETRARLYWTFDRGRLNESQPAYGEAEYDLMGETTGAINSVLFDTARTAESFFANPYGLVPEPVGKSLIPRFDDASGIAVTNLSSSDAEITYIARRFDGSLVSDNGIENPVTYRFAAGQQFVAFPHEIFRLNSQDRRPILSQSEVGWMEIFSDDGDLQSMFLDADSAATALDGNIGAETGGTTLVFPDLRLGAGESTEIALLNLSYDALTVHLQLLNREGSLLREEREFFIAGYGSRTFYLGESSEFLSVNDPSQVASLKVSCGGQSSNCPRLVGLATFRDRFNSLASAYAVSEESAGAILAGPHFATGPNGDGEWETVVRIARLSGVRSAVTIDLYDAVGTRLHTMEQTVSPGGQASFALNSSTLPWRDRFTTGYVRVRADSGAIAGGVSLSWSNGRGSMSSTYPLASQLSPLFHFNQVAQGSAGAIDYWTGIALVNELDRPVNLTVSVLREDGSLDRSADLTLQPLERYAALLSQIFEDSSYTRLNGYIQVAASEPIAATVLYGDSTSRFLSAVPGIPR